MSGAGDTAIPALVHGKDRIRASLPKRIERPPRVRLVERAASYFALPNALHHRDEEDFALMPAAEPAIDAIAQ